MAKKVRVSVQNSVRRTGNFVRVSQRVSVNGRAKTCTKTIRLK